MTYRRALHTIRFCNFSQQQKYALATQNKIDLGKRKIETHTHRDRDRDQIEREGESGRKREKERKREGKRKCRSTTNPEDECASRGKGR